MKKLLVTALALGTMMLMSTSVFAAEPTPYVCPNGNTACVTNGACINHGQCQYPNGCPNGGKHDGTGHNANGTGHQNGNHTGGRHGGHRNR